jgi:hypothetical protein
LQPRHSLESFDLSHSLWIPSSVIWRKIAVTTN